MGILELLKGPLFGHHIQIALGTRLTILEHTSPDLPHLAILSPLVKCNGQSLQVFFLLAEDAAQTFFHCGLVLIFCLFVVGGDLAIG